MSLTLNYQNKIYSEMIEGKDGLLIISPGLGLSNIISQFINLYKKPSGNNNSIGLIFLLNADYEVLDPFLINYNSIIRIDSNTLSSERQELYLKGGIISITSRILIVDMLSNRVPIHLITGFLILNAHSIKSHSADNFILRLFKQENKEGFIKAFTDRPELFATGFSPLEKTLKNLFLRHAYLYPRFQIEVAEELENKKIEVIEFHQPLTKKMNIIQQSIMDNLDICLLDLKRSKILKEIEDDLTLENALSKNFVYIIKHYLEPQWHKINFKYKELINDIHILRSLLNYLTNYDCITFLKYLDTIISTINNSNPSPWLLTDCTNAMILAARTRVYSTDTSSTPHTYKPVLEVQPKWKLVKQLVNEIKEESKKSNLKPRILIATSSVRSTFQIKNYLLGLKEENLNDKHPMMNGMYIKYWNWKNELNQMTQNQIKSTTDNNQNRKNTFNKRRRVRNINNQEQGIQTNIKSFFNVQKSDDNVVVKEKEEKDKQETKIEIENNDLDLEESNEFDASTFNQYFKMISNEEETSFYELIIFTLTGDLDDLLLIDFKPTHVIMLDPNPNFIRQLEVYQANNNINIKVYFLLYKDSVEEQKFLAQVRKEKESFETLIKERASLAIPIDFGINKNDDALKSLLITERGNSRIAGGQKINSIGSGNKVVVDVREFRSSLVSHLNYQGFQILPANLLIGDYIISPTICIERKSIPDLIGSFKSGRLYNQIQNMLKYYPTTVLLIEFDENKAFGLEEIGDQRVDWNLSDIRSKLTLLTITFPKLKLIWSPSPTYTGEIIWELKKGLPDPDVDTCIKIGTNEQDELNQLFNSASVELLKSLPGITHYNFKKIINNVNNIKDLCDKSLDDLKLLIGDQDAKLLFEFINKVVVLE